MIKASYKMILFFLIVFVYSLAPTSQVSLAQEETQESITADKIALDKNIIYVNPKTGEDSQSGEKQTPFKTITKALKEAKVGTKIQLTSGTYSEETGEIFPLIIDQEIVLQGNLINQGHNILIKGSGDFVSPTGAGQNVAIAVLNDAGKIAGITVTNEHSRGHGIWIESSSPEIVSNTFTRNGNTGVSVNGKSLPTIEDNYFYNNSGNGLLVYGTSHPKVDNNTFEQTGFGVSLIQNAISTLTNNHFDGNRIGIILEGNSQAILRDNEIINSSESGLTAIARSRVDLGTSNEPGNNIFRSNKKLDIQNATSNQIVAVGTQSNGHTNGNINFYSGEFTTLISNSQDLPPALTPLENKVETQTPVSLASPNDEDTSLPSPPPVIEEKTRNKELVFTPSSSIISEVPSPEPVPFSPQINNSILGSNNSQVNSLSDVLGSKVTASVKYKVLVEAADEYAENRVRSFYPEAFKTIYQGKSVLQVGAFNNWAKAQTAKRTLENLGFNIYILE